MEIAKIVGMDFSAPPKDIQNMPPSSSMDLHSFFCIKILRGWFCQHGPTTACKSIP